MKSFTVITLLSGLLAQFPISSRSTSLTVVQRQISPQAALERLFTSPQVESDWFATSFLNQVPLAQIQQIIAQLQTDLGAYQRVQAEGDRYLVIFARGRVAAQIALDSQNQIIGLLFQSAPEALTPEKAIAQLKTFPGEVNFLIAENGSQLAALNPDRPLAVGSTFKLAVLAALRKQIESNQRTWRDVVELQSSWKSLPSGFLQSWPDESALTLQTLATLMISISDNTATDALIRILGRESVEALSDRNQPFLTTRELFTLKAKANQELLQRYRAANLAEKRQILTEIAQYPLPDIGATPFDGKPTALDIEWHFTPYELCKQMAGVADLPLMSVNPGGSLVNPKNWARVAYKGGSEPGVLNLTTWLEAKNGKSYCVVATWNNSDAALDEKRLYELYSSVIKGLETRN